MTLNVSRTLYFNFILLIGVTDWFVKNFEPDKNIVNWIAGIAGAFVIRFAYSDLPIRVSIGGFITGFILACLYAGTLMDIADTNGYLIRPTAAWGTVGLAGDGIIQLIGWIFRLSNKVGDGVIANPGEAFDSGIERATKLAEVVAKIKNILPDSVLNLFKKL